MTDQTCPNCDRLLLLEEEVKRYRRAMLRLRRMCVAHRKTKRVFYPTCGWFSDAEAVVTSALSKRRAKRGS